MDMDTCFFPHNGEVLEKSVCIELSVDAIGDVLCERLNAELDLNGTVRIFGHGLEEFFWNFVRHHFEME